MVSEWHYFAASTTGKLVSGNVYSNEAGKFLAWLADKDYCGYINAASYGSISIFEIITYIEHKTGIKAILSNDGDNAPYNGSSTNSLNLCKSEEIGFIFSQLNTWVYNLLDIYINLAMA